MSLVRSHVCVTVSLVSAAGNFEAFFWSPLGCQIAFLHEPNPLRLYWNPTSL